MPEWPISYKYEGLQPQCKMTKQLGNQTWVDMMKWSSPRILTTINAFSSNVITAKASTAHTSERIDVMTQALHVKDSSLPQGLMVQNVYTELRKGSKNVIMVVRNSMAYLQMLKKTPVARTVEVTWVPEPLVQTGLMGMMGEAEDNGHQMPKLTMKQRQ